MWWSQLLILKLIEQLSWVALSWIFLGICQQKIYRLLLAEMKVGGIITK